MHAGLARMEDLETTWSLDDVYRALAVLDIKGAVEDEAAKDAARKAR